MVWFCAEFFLTKAGKGKSTLNKISTFTKMGSFSWFFLLPLTPPGHGLVLSLILFKFLTRSVRTFWPRFSFFKKKKQNCVHILLTSFTKGLVPKARCSQVTLKLGRGDPQGVGLSLPSPPPESLCGQLPSGVYALLMHPDNLPLSMQEVRDPAQVETYLDTGPEARKARALTCLLW